MIGSKFGYTKGTIKATPSPAIYPPKVTTWDQVEIDIKTLTGGIDEETKEHVLSPDDLEEITITVYPGDVVNCVLKAKGKFNQLSVPIHSFHIELAEYPCAKNTWAEFDKKKIVENSIATLKEMFPSESS